MRLDRTVYYPLITALVLVSVWHLSVSLAGVPSYILPEPGAVGRALWYGLAAKGSYWPHVGFTVKSVIVGYAIGCAAAVFLGVLLSESRTAEMFLFPYVIAMQSVPKIALAPLIIVWFGYDLMSKVVMVALICFFPIFVNTMVGVRSADRDLVDLYRSFSAGRLSILWNVKLPSAVGHIFAGLQIAQVLALIGAIVAEFSGSRMGLGYLIQSATVNLDVAMVFAIVMILATIGISGTQLIRFAHRRLVFWEKAAAERASMSG
jgi:NitT/TauT family transport system permease protein